MANSIGMKLEEFKPANKGQQVWVNTGDRRKPYDKTLTKLVDTPLCTDSLQQFEGSTCIADRKLEEVICNISPGKSAAKLIGNLQMVMIIYRFYDGKLFGVEMFFGAKKFAGMRNAFVDKFGPKFSVATTRCQNGSGAAWSSYSLSWQVSPTASATLNEKVAATGRGRMRTIRAALERSQRLSWSREWSNENSNNLGNICDAPVTTEQYLRSFKKPAPLDQLYRRCNVAEDR